MEQWLQDLVAKLNWLNVGDERLQAEFASHLGWSLAVPLFVYYLNPRWYLWALLGWALYAVEKETLEDGHLKRLWNKSETPEEFKDFYTDLLARLLPVLVLLLIEVIR